MTTFDDRSEKNIATLLPKAQEQARVFLGKVLDAGINAKIIGGTRTFPEQDALFAQGRTKPGSIVTNARGGFSNHNFGIAWDIGIFNGSRFLDDSPLYDTAGEIGKNLGLEWGGDFRTIVDKPHFQCRTGKTLSQLRALKSAGGEIPIQDLVATTPDTVAVFLNGDALDDVPAFLIGGRVFVGVRAFVRRIGGMIEHTGGNPFTVTVGIDENSDVEVPGQIIDGVGFVKFADVNALYKLSFTFDGSQNRLDITRPTA